MLLGHDLAQRPVGVGQVAQHHALAAAQLVAGDEVGEGHRVLHHLAHHRLRRQLVLGDPRVGLLVHLQGGGEHLGQRLGPGDLLQGGHALLVVHALGLHRGDRLAAGGALLGVEQRARIVQGGLDDADDVDRVLRGLHVQQVHGR